MVQHRCTRLDGKDAPGEVIGAAAQGTGSGAVGDSSRTAPPYLPRIAETPADASGRGGERLW